MSKRFRLADAADVVVAAVLLVFWSAAWPWPSSPFSRRDGGGGGEDVIVVPRLRAHKKRSGPR
jgi:hypothetical protein